jgi:hypothetical protein
MLVVIQPVFILILVVIVVFVLLLLMMIVKPGMLCRQRVAKIIHQFFFCVGHMAQKQIYIKNRTLPAIIIKINEHFRLVSQLLSYSRLVTVVLSFVLNLFASFFHILTIFSCLFFFCIFQNF